MTSEELNHLKRSIMHKGLTEHADRLLCDASNAVYAAIANKNNDAEFAKATERARRLIDDATELQQEAKTYQSL